MGFWSECDVNWSLSLDGALHTPTEPTSVYGGWGRDTPPAPFPSTASLEQGVPMWLVMFHVQWSHVRFAFYIKAFWFPFISLQKFSAICHYVPQGRGLQTRDTRYMTKTNKDYAATSVCWVPFTASEMKMMCWVKHCTGAANNIIFRKWWFGVREATWRWAQLWSCL